MPGTDANAFAIAWRARSKVEAAAVCGDSGAPLDDVFSSATSEASSERASCRRVAAATSAVLS